VLHVPVGAKVQSLDDLERAVNKPSTQSNAMQNDADSAGKAQTLRSKSLPDSLLTRFPNSQFDQRFTAIFINGFKPKRAAAFFGRTIEF
jgi:hypothetical protein